jgi:hypothetical protein
MSILSKIGRFLIDLDTLENFKKSQDFDVA